MDKKEEAVVENEVETTTQPSPPQDEAPTTQEQTTQPKATDEEVSDVDTDKPADPREFQIKRLAQENKRLKAERVNAFDAFRPKAIPTTGVDVQAYTDEYGQTNWNAYNAAVSNHIQQAASVQATTAVQEQLDEQNARTKHPELFEDADTEQEIADRWLAAKLRGETVTISEMADRVAKRYSRDVSKAEKRGAEKILAEVSTKEQAGLAVSGETSRASRQAQSDEEMARLSAETRVGNQEAIVARLKNIPWANK